MAKKKSWFSLLKRLFIWETNSKTQKKEKKRRWLFGRPKTRQLMTLSAPSPPRERTLSEAEDEHSRHAVALAIATAAAADAAVAAAQVAAEIVRLSGTPQSSHQSGNEQEFSPIEIQSNAPTSVDQCDRIILRLAATKIQTAFRGYLARKALRALKGLVRVQAIIRGRAVRRQAITTLKCLQSIVNIQSQVCARRCQMAEGTLSCPENQDLLNLQDKEIKIDANSQKRWDCSILSKQEANAVFLSKKEAFIKRERIKEYSSSRRRSTESEQNKANVKWKNWLEHWVDSQLAKREELQNLDTTHTSNSRNKEEFGARQIKTKNLKKHYQIDALDSPMHIPRRSFHCSRQSSMGNDSSLMGSLAVPTYMAATESAKAKARSLSSPRLRPVNLDAYSKINSPHRHKLSPISSINSDATCSSVVGSSVGFQQRSPCLKGHPGPIKSNRSFKEISFNSECPLPIWDRYGGFT